MLLTLKDHLERLSDALGEAIDNNYNKDQISNINDGLLSVVEHIFDGRSLEDEIDI